MRGGGSYNSTARGRKCKSTAALTAALFMGVLYASMVSLARACNVQRPRVRRVVHSDELAHAPCFACLAQHRGARAFKHCGREAVVNCHT